MKKLLLSLSLLFALNSFSQTINATEIELNFAGDSYPENFTKGITKMYFAADDGINMKELWVYDTVTNTTHLVKDVGSGNSGLNNSILMTIGDILYFTVNTGSQLWRSDGTEAGTYLVKLISTTPASNNTITALFNYNGNVVFDAYDPTNGKELWISDGTTAGTTLLKDIRPGTVGSNPRSFFICNGILYFAANDGVNGNEIWKSDGTTAGTTILKNIDGTSNDSIISDFIVLNNAFYFYCYSTAEGFELWKSDGTDSGTQIFKDIVPGTGSSAYTLYGIAGPNYFIFVVDSPTIGRELWICDGTVAGTTLLKDINPGGNGILYNAQFTWFDNKVYFNASHNAYGEELWATDGTTNGTLLVKDIQPGIASSNITKLTATSNFLIFSAQVSSHPYSTPWRSDGTDAGTFELKDTNLTTTTAGNLSFLGFNNMAFFGAGYNSLNGNELWSTDGTIANTILFKDIYHRYSGMIDFFDSAQLGNNLIYTGNRGDGNGDEPSISDGTISGTHIINTSGGVNFFTSAGFRGASYTKAGNYVFFRASNGTNGYEIWKTDGTQANTSMVKDIKVGNASSISEYPLFMEYNGIFYFKADDGIHGEELWRSDGTDIGTYLLKDINIGSASSLSQSNINYNHTNYINERCYAVLNGYLYFTANDGTDNSIWKTNGTEAGTIKVITIPSAGTNDRNRVIINASNNKIFFKTNTTNSSSGNYSLWSSDGTQAGTTFLIDPNINSSVNYLKSIIHNNELYFTLYTSNWRALMKTDGTVSGTIIVKDNFTSQQSFPSLTSCGGYVYFTLGDQNISGRELWRTNGTTLGTVKLGDYSTSPSQYFLGCNVCYQNNLLFLSNNQDNKIYYVNGSSTDANSYLTTNVINSTDSYSDTSGNLKINSLFNNNGTILLSARTDAGGTELYSTTIDFTLGDHDFTSELADKTNIIIYPNPAKQSVHFLVNNGEIILKASIYDLLGKKIFSSNITNNQLELPDIGNGIYIVNMVTDKSQYNTKIVIKK